MNAAAPLFFGLLVRTFPIFFLAPTRGLGPVVVRKIHKRVEIEARPLAGDIGVIRRRNEADGLRGSCVQIGQVMSQEVRGVGVKVVLVVDDGVVG